MSFGTVTGLVLKVVPDLDPDLVRENMIMTFYVRLGVKIKNYLQN